MNLSTLLLLHLWTLMRLAEILYLIHQQMNQECHFLVDIQNGTPNYSRCSKHRPCRQISSVDSSIFACCHTTVILKLAVHIFHCHKGIFLFITISMHVNTLICVASFSLPTRLTDIALVFYFLLNLKKF